MLSLELASTLGLPSAVLSLSFRVCERHVILLARQRTRQGWWLDAHSGQELCIAGTYLPPRRELTCTHAQYASERCEVAGAGQPCWAVNVRHFLMTTALRCMVAMLQAGTIRVCKHTEAFETAVL